MSFSDADLIARVILNDDRNAFGELVRRHQSNVRGMLRKLCAGDYALADDLSQDTFIRAYQSLAKFRGAARFSTWLYRIAYNQYLSHARRKREFTSLEKSPIEESEPSRIEHLQLKQDLDSAMKQLTSGERAAINLWYHQGLSHGEAAEVLSSPIGTVKTNIPRGKEKLKKYLQPWAKGN